MRTIPDTSGTNLKYEPSRSNVPAWAQMTRTLPAAGTDELLTTLLWDRKRELEPGRVYILKERKPKRAVELFLQCMERGLRPLYVSRQHPNHVLPGRPEGAVRVVWLSATLGNDYVDPHNLSGLSNLISSFIAESGGSASVVLLDGLEYLMVNNEPDRVFKFYSYLDDSVATHRAVLLAPVDERAFSAKDLALFERNAIVLDRA